MVEDFDSCRVVQWSAGNGSWASLGNVLLASLSDERDDNLVLHQGDVIPSLRSAGGLLFGRDGNIDGQGGFQKRYDRTRWFPGTESLKMNLVGLFEAQGMVDDFCAIDQMPFFGDVVCAVPLNSRDEPFEECIIVLLGFKIPFRSGTLFPLLRVCSSADGVGLLELRPLFASECVERVTLTIGGNYDGSRMPGVVLPSGPRVLNVVLCEQLDFQQFFDLDLFSVIQVTEEFVVIVVETPFLDGKWNPSAHRKHLAPETDR